MPIGLATRANNAAIGSEPSRCRAWKIADFDGGKYLYSQPELHASPTINWLNTPSCEPSATAPSHSRIYAITRAGNVR